MSLAEQIKRYTPQEYYALEHKAAYKSDYCDGEIFAMAGGTAAHSLIASNLLREVGNRLKGRPCAAYESNLRLKVKATGLRCYPDVSVYWCRFRQPHLHTAPAFYETVMGGRPVEV